MKLDIALIHCGCTKSGEQGRYLGLRDEPLSARGRAYLRKRVKKGVYPQATLVYAGTALRCRETAGLIYPATPAVLLKEFGPFDYGSFEGKTQEDLYQDREFKKWACKTAINTMPNGENPYVYSSKIFRTFRLVAKEMCSKGIQSATIIAHATVIAILMKRFCITRSIYHKWRPDYGEGYLLEFDSVSGKARIEKKL